MAQPTRSDVHIDAPLTNVSVAYVQDAANFIATQVFPVVRVDKSSDKYFVFDKNAFLQDDVQRRAPGTPSAGSGYTVSSTSYSADVWALHKKIDNQTVANTDASLGDPREAAAVWVTQQMLQRMERQFVTDFFTTSVWGTDSTPSNLWSNYTTSDPISDVETGKETIMKNTGMEPNTLVLGYQVFRQLKHHPDIVDRFKYTSAQSITPAMLAAIFDIERVLVAKAVKATNIENQTGAYDFTFGKNALLCYSASAPGLRTPTAGYTFMWTGPSGELGTPTAISSWYEQKEKSEYVEIEAAWDNKVVGTDLGYFFSGAVA